ncbi:hypothetical protein TVAG_383640 [Trichomonas vaginalis G3]|uniref:Uncharacterized protein n=1 Tax=Trichomonas vaginalis (strain ATCC PRA-98 / G3) TaxID=412133 RepID=A2EZ73_TRIV3|nr:bifunctional inhibitor/lipid-transfer protein/seed storage 2s albumin superfamily protein family [Trichomonas vaginalis G3]EAY02061.1 hypothetical protein TVAG_383640 [Trichomonas vaginalis G3]KAI5514291.1 bifunctional inhibitor/lipid-transfer protein/seed storage 2s albumin superfamily protein family [Trichomonas vaginalis G3]|eukprot:XP_001330515.1 hypothetical protein [Trichomonas vaginalis G3]
MVNGGNFGASEKNIGVDVMLFNDQENAIFWYLVYDCLQDWDISTRIIGKGSIQHIPGTECDNSPALTENYQKNSYAETSNPTTSPDIETSSVPSPTIYTYVATPITRLPKQTPQTGFSTTTNYEKKVTTVYKDTISPTPHETPFSTASETPFSTIFTTAAETPFSTAFETPYSTASTTAAETPFSTASKTPFLTEFKTAFDTLFKTAFETPVDTPSSTAIETPFITAYETPFLTAYETAFDTPFLTAIETPFLTAFETPFVTVFETPFSTAHMTPGITPFDTVFSTAHSTPFNTAFSTPHFTLFPSTPPPTLKSNETMSTTTTLTTVLTSTLTMSSSSTLIETNITEYTLTNTTSSTVEEDTSSYFETLINSSYVRTTFVSQVTFYVVPTSIYIITNVTYITVIYVEDNTHANSMKSSTVILISAIVIASIFCLALIGITLYRKSHDETSTSSTFEETVSFDSDPGHTMTEMHIVDDTDDIVNIEQELEMDNEDGTFEPMDQMNYDEDERFLNGDF